jgi:superfamily II RNA helicase
MLFIIIHFVSHHYTFVFLRPSRTGTAKFGFWPDKWQWALLNAVDAEPPQSALVIAPTSAGKSFISYYVIEKVLDNNSRCARSVDTGVVVVVLPTKALVNQVSAVVYQKYGDVYGVFAGNKHKVLDCQVLITQPTELEILLTSPATKEWVKKIQYVVFDEVHCIGDSSEGAVWERLLTMLQVRNTFFSKKNIY